jgi:uncharacterized protein
MIVRLLGFYQRWISPALHSISGAGGACRFQPTCSEYAAVAVERHGACRCLALAIWRLLRCNPLSRGGFDPVPDTLYRNPCRDFGTDQHRHLP